LETQPYKIKEVELPWLGSLTAVALFENPGKTFNDFVRDAARYDDGNRYAAWNDVRLIRSPHEVLPASYYHTGLEGYPVGVWQAEQIVDYKADCGRGLLDGIVKYHRYDRRLRKQLDMMMGLHPSWGLRILTECNAFVGSTIARMRSLASSSGDPQKSA
jgi:hypothetical protein